MVAEAMSATETTIEDATRSEFPNFEIGFEWKGEGMERSGSLGDLRGSKEGGVLGGRKSSANPRLSPLVESQEHGKEEERGSQAEEKDCFGERRPSLTAYDWSEHYSKGREANPHLHQKLMSRKLSEPSFSEKAGGSQRMERKRSLVDLMKLGGLRPVSTPNREFFLVFGKH